MTREHLRKYESGNQSVRELERPRKRRNVDIEEDMQIMGIRRWRKQCTERAEWKRITEKAKTHSGL
jgi:hypothetical protein